MKNTIFKLIRIGGVLMLVAGPLFLAGSAYSVHRTLDFKDRAMIGDGYVVELIEKAGDGGVTFAPVYIFLDQSGFEHKVYSTTSSYPPSYAVGDKIKVLYDALDPKSAKIDAAFELWGISIISGALGGVYLVLGATIFAFRKKLREC